MAGSGLQAQEALAEAVKKYSGKYICVIEGSIPTRDKGVYMKLAGRPAMEVLADVGGKAAAIIAIGSCAAWGGIPSADPDPTGAVGVADLLPNQTIVNLPGCPPNPYTLLGVVLQFADSGTLPEMDHERRPKFAYDRDIHEHCPRRAHFDAGNFVKQFGDQGHREGWCLYEMGCKGPDTHAGCSTRHFNEIPDVWPIGIGAPCIGCTEKSIAFRVPMFKVVQIHTLAAPPSAYAPISAPQGVISPLAAGAIGLAVGALAGAGYVASRKFSTVKDDESVPGSSPTSTPEKPDASRVRKAQHEPRSRSRADRSASSQPTAGSPGNSRAGRNDYGLGSTRAGKRTSGPSCGPARRGLHALRQHHLHRVQSLHAGVQRGQRPAPRYGALRRHLGPASGSQLENKKHHQALSGAGWAWLLLRQAAVHALPRSRLRDRLPVWVIKKSRLGCGYME
jgi:hydrogenase small subunit